jgi:hypothetical protein
VDEFNFDEYSYYSACEIKNLLFWRCVQILEGVVSIEVIGSSRGFIHSVISYCYLTVSSFEELMDQDHLLDVLHVDAFWSKDGTYSLA